MSNVPMTGLGSNFPGMSRWACYEVTFVIVSLSQLAIRFKLWPICSISKSSIIGNKSLGGDEISFNGGAKKLFLQYPWNP